MHPGPTTKPGTARGNGLAPGPSHPPPGAAKARTAAPAAAIRAQRLILALSLLLAGLLTAAARAGEASRGTPGDFDYYLLSLSWSPSYCEAEGNPPEPQCRGRPARRPFAFVVHGLWPQYEHGWPQYCDPTPAWVPQRRIEAMLDIVPNRSLVIHQWKKHGTCSGLSVAAYFDLLRAARDRIVIPAEFRRIDKYVMVSPQAVEASFRRANRGLGARMISVTCDRRRLREVLICLTRDLRFRDCPNIERRACRRDRVVMPPLR